MPSAAKGAASPWFEVRAQNLLMVKVYLLLEVSLYARGPRKGDVCHVVAFHEEMPKIPSRYTCNNIYARGPRKGDECHVVAFHEEMPKIPSRYM